MILQRQHISDYRFQRLMIVFPIVTTLAWSASLWLHECHVTVRHVVTSLRTSGQQTRGVLAAFNDVVSS